VADATVGNGSAQRLGDVLLSSDLGESSWAIFSSQRCVGHNLKIRAE
jgi:hypothetical protein